MHKGREEGEGRKRHISAKVLGKPGYIGYLVTGRIAVEGINHTLIVLPVPTMLSGETSPEQRDQASVGEMLSDALGEMSEGSETQPSGHGGHRLSTQQKEWARHFVLNGGNATAAARAAGYAGAEKAGYRNTLNASIRMEIERLSVALLGSKLPWLIGKACDIIENSEADDKARVSAILGLMDRAGLRPKSSPLVSINNTNNTVNINGATAQDAIRQVWQVREARLNASLSDIGGGMSDTQAPLIEYQPDAAGVPLEASAAPGRGGCVDPGPPPRRVPIPGHSSEHPAQTPEARQMENPR